MLRTILTDFLSFAVKSHSHCRPETFHLMFLSHISTTFTWIEIVHTHSWSSEDETWWLRRFLNFLSCTTVRLTCLRCILVRCWRGVNASATPRHNLCSSHSVIISVSSLCPCDNGGWSYTKIIIIKLYILHPVQFIHFILLSIQLPGIPPTICS